MPSREVAVGSLRRSHIARTVDYRQTSNAAAVLTATLDHGPVARSSVARPGDRARAHRSRRHPP
jgi:hypothetical protein